jgi:hypothetical protein
MQIGHLIICYVIKKGKLELLRQQPLLKFCNVVPLDIDLLNLVVTFLINNITH